MILFKKQPKFRLFVFWLFFCVSGCAVSPYDRAIADAKIAETSEIRPLKTLPQTGKILLMTMHNVPEIYRPHTTFKNTREVLWTVTADEWTAFESRHCPCKRLRYLQLLGLPADTPSAYVSLIETDVKNVRRPAYQPNPHSDKMTATLSKDAPEDFKNWFERNESASYDPPKYPWTRLGYTYDWSKTGDVYGLTEFIILKDAKVSVKATKKIAD